MSSVTELLGRKKNEIKAPPLPPIGHYRLKVYRKHSINKSRDDKWTFVEIFAQGVAAQEDVDPDEMNEYGRGVENIRLRRSFIYNNASDDEAAAANEDTDFRLQEFLNMLGVEGEEDESLLEQLARIEGLEFIGYVTLQEDKNNPEIKRPQISRSIALADHPDYL